MYKKLMANAVRAFKGSSVADEARRLRGAPARRVLEILAVRWKAKTRYRWRPRRTRAMTRGC